MTQQMARTHPRFFIREGYIENVVPAYFHDDGESGIVFQPDVYDYAAELARWRGTRTIVDIGCGRAEKLAAIHERHPSWNFLGVDYGPNIEWCRDHFGDWGEWLDADLATTEGLGALARAVTLHARPLIVCSDVIEHLADPTPMLKALLRLKPAAVVITTPERELCYGPDHLGPPPNLCHVREWNRAELGLYLLSVGFEVWHLGLTRSNDQEPDERTTLAVVS